MSTRRSFLVTLSALASLPALASIGACGYRPLRSVVAGSPRLVVERAEPLVPGGRGVDLAGEAAYGARAELARYGALGDAGSGAGAGEAAVDRLGVVIVRVDERSEGVAPELSPGASTPGGDAPIARGVRVRVLARGLVRGARGEWETPDLEASDVLATPGSAPGWSGARDAAIRELARTAGAKVARAVLGLP